MISLNIARVSLTKVFGHKVLGLKVLGLIVLSGLLSGPAIAAETATPGSVVTNIPRRPEPSAVELQSWRKAIIKTPRPKTACFKATYPATEWTEVPCATPPHILFPPRRKGVGIATNQVGGSGPDFDAEVTTGHISEAEGQFDSVKGVTSVSPNQFSLQLNTNFLSGSKICKSAPNPSCQEWEQFVYSTNACEGSSAAGSGYIQYWLLEYGNPTSSCPGPTASAAACNANGGVVSSGWCQFQFSSTGPLYCVINSASCSSPGAQPITSLGDMSVNGSVAGVHGTNSNDEIVITVGGTVYVTPGNNYFTDLDSTWNEAEFNVFGNGGGSSAAFNSGSTLEVRTSVASGVTTAPECASPGFTGESNNLTLVATSSNPSPSGFPSVVFTESNVPGSTQVTCASAITLGDTHVHTFDGLEYDFQAYGDFLLVENGPDFAVQTRQIPGPAGYPDTAVNQGVAVRMGATRVVVYMQPTELVIDGQVNNLADGKSVLQSTGVQVTRHGDGYVIADDSGNIVTATIIDPLWMDVAVALGHSAKSARGLLGNPQGSAQAIETASGVVMKAPVAFTDLYGPYADSWRVQPNDSLFVEHKTVRTGVPNKPIRVEDLAPAATAHAMTVCKAAGVTHQALLDDCILDTTVMQDDRAVKVFTRIALPHNVLKPVLKLTP